jgi:hypothetical protein
MTPGRLIPLAAGILLLGYGLWALYSGKVISTWGQMAQRPNAFYWIATVAFILVGVLNLIVAFRISSK